jgi:hypothetical protein
MGLFARLVKFLSGDNGFKQLRNDKGRLVDLKWRKGRLPVAIYIDGDLPALLDEVTLAVREFNAAIGVRVFQFPVAAIPEMAQTFYERKSRQFLRSACLIRAENNGLRYHGDTNIDFDNRTGEIFSAIVSVPLDVSEWTPAIIRHELGHALGLDHDDGDSSVLMHPHVSAPGAKLSTRDVRLLRDAYVSNGDLSIVWRG